MMGASGKKLVDGFPAIKPRPSQKGQEQEKPNDFRNINTGVGVQIRQHFLESVFAITPGEASAQGWPEKGLGGLPHGVFQEMHQGAEA